MNTQLNRAVDFIIRPSRTSYYEDELGPKSFQHQSKIYERVDFDIQYYSAHYHISTQSQLNNPMQIIKCSFYGPKQNKSKVCALALHGNIGNRVSSLSHLHTTLEMGLSFACFDFLGCGNSEGEYITLGYEQKFQILAVIREIQFKFGCNKFILNGRSMGAAAALLFCACIEEENNFQILGLILDSPYYSTEDLFKSIAKCRMSWLPQFIVDVALSEIDSRIQNKNGHPQWSLVKDVSIPSKLSLNFPVFILYGHQDNVITMEHVVQVFNRLQCCKKLQIIMDQGHGECRSNYEKQNALRWVLSFTKSHNNLK